MNRTLSDSSQPIPFDKLIIVRKCNSTDVILPHSTKFNEKLSQLYTSLITPLSGPAKSHLSSRTEEILRIIRFISSPIYIDAVGRWLLLLLVALTPLRISINFIGFGFGTDLSYNMWVQITANQFQFDPMHEQCDFSYANRPARTFVSGLCGSAKASVDGLPLDL